MVPTPLMLSAGLGGAASPPLVGAPVVVSDRLSWQVTMERGPKGPGTGQRNNPWSTIPITTVPEEMSPFFQQL